MRSSRTMKSDEDAKAFICSKYMPWVFLAIFLVGILFFVSWLGQWTARDSPIVTGTIVSRKPITQWTVTRWATPNGVDFTIELALDQIDPPTTVHAYTRGNLMDRIPNRVRFRYSGNPSQEVFLFEYEENPLWIAITCCAGAVILGFLRRHIQSCTATSSSSEA